MTETICPNCGKIGRTSKILPANAKLRCSGCQQVFIYLAVHEEDVILDVDFDLASKTSTLQAGSVRPTKDCFYCGEEILLTAKKCKHCGEFLDGSFKPPASASVVAAVPPPVQQVVVYATSKPAWNPGIAALLSFLIPGAGQLYRGEVLGGLIWMFVIIIGYLCFIVPGLVLHLICIIMAGTGEPALPQPASALDPYAADRQARQNDPARQAIADAARQRILDQQERDCERREELVEQERQQKEMERQHRRNRKIKYYQDLGIEPGPMAWFKALPDSLQAILMGLAATVIIFISLALISLAS